MSKILAKCIDVSTWQGDIDWSKVKATGYDYAIIRAGFGRSVSQVDSRFEEYYKNAKAAGVKLGAYWYSYAVDKADALKEAKACISIIKGKSFELPVFYDMEESFQTELGKAALTAMAKAFMDELSESGYKAGIYANANWFNNYLDHDFLYNNYYVWLAQYNTEPQFDCHIWQYSSSAKIIGIEGNVDINNIYSAELLDLPIDNTEPSEQAQLKIKSKGIDVLMLKYLLQIAADLNIISFDMTLGNDVFGVGTEKAVKLAQKVLGLVQSGVVDEGFVNKLYIKIKEKYPQKGDVNGDGKINISDVTALQKQLAGVDGYE